MTFTPSFHIQQAKNKTWMPCVSSVLHSPSQPVTDVLVGVSQMWTERGEEAPQDFRYSPLLLHYRMLDDVQAAVKTKRAKVDRSQSTQTVLKGTRINKHPRQAYHWQGEVVPCSRINMYITYMEMETVCLAGVQIMHTWHLRMIPHSPSGPTPSPLWTSTSACGDHDSPGVAETNRQHIKHTAKARL